MGFVFTFVFLAQAHLFGFGLTFGFFELRLTFWALGLHFLAQDLLLSFVLNLGLSAYFFRFGLTFSTRA